MDRYNMFNENGYYEPDRTYYRMRVTNGSYQVQPGDNLAKIAIEFGTTIDEIIKLNNLTTTTIIPGQVLLIPEPVKTTSYIVQPGDNLYQIAKTHNTTVDELVELNSLENTTLYPNQVLLIPYQETGTGMYYKEYITAEGDSLESIAAKYNTDPKKLMMYNDCLKLLLAPNQEIVIPAKYKKYEVIPGDTWETILEKTGLTCEELLEINQQKWLKPGKSIFIK